MGHAGVIQEQSGNIHLATHKVVRTSIAKLKAGVLGVLGLGDVGRPPGDLVAGASAAGHGGRLGALEGVVDGHVDGRLHDVVASARVLGLESALFDALVDGRVLVADSVAQVGGLAAGEVVARITLDLGPGGTVVVQAVEDLVVILLRKGAALAAVRLFEGAVDAQLGQVFHVLAMGAALFLLGRFRVGGALGTLARLFLADQDVFRVQALAAALAGIRVALGSGRLARSELIGTASAEAILEITGSAVVECKVGVLENICPLADAMAVDTEQEVIRLLVGPLAPGLGGSLAALGGALVRLGGAPSVGALVGAAGAVVVVMHVPRVGLVGGGGNGREEGGVRRRLVEAVDDGGHDEGLLGGLLLLERLGQLDHVVDVHGGAAAFLVVAVVGALGAVVAVGPVAAVPRLARVGVVEEQADGIRVRGARGRSMAAYIAIEPRQRPVAVGVQRKGMQRGEVCMGVVRSRCRLVEEVDETRLDGSHRGQMLCQCRGGHWVMMGIKGRGKGRDAMEGGQGRN